MVRLYPLGGLGEFGANSLVCDAEGAGRLVLDAGAAFGDETVFGVSYEVPDFAALGEPAPKAAVLTHAHDDHCKGLPVLLGAWPDTVVAGSHTTLTWCRPLLPPRHRRVAELQPARPWTAGGWEIEALPVSHSIPGTVVLRVRGGGVTIVLATDVRLAPSALGETTPVDCLETWGKEAVDILLLDATNAFVTTPPPPEATVESTLGELIRKASGLVVVVTFASHVGRFRQVARAAVAAGRVVVPAGRGLLEALALQAKVGGAGALLDVVRPFREVSRLDRDSLVVVVTGSQGEAGSTFTRLAQGELWPLGLQPGDLVLHAARIIPGNERRLASLFDCCVRQGAKVVTASEAPIHASGHPPRQELTELLSLLRPRVVVPVHGWRRHLEAAAELARAVGAAAVVAGNGEELSWTGGEVEVTGQCRPVGRVFFGEAEGELIAAGVLSERRGLARAGVVVAVVAFDNGGTPRVCLSSRGLRLSREVEEELVAGLRGEVVRASAGGPVDADDVRLTMERWLRRELRRHCPQRPAVVVSVLPNSLSPGAGVQCL